MIQVQKRLVLNLPNFGVVVVDKEGIHNLDTITPEVRITFQKYLMVNVVKQIQEGSFICILLQVIAKHASA